MKRILIILGVIIVLLVAAVFILPPFFKDDIRAAIDKELENTVDATVYFDTDSFSLSLLSNFPNITVTLNDFGVVGKGAFDGDTLASVKAMELELDLMKLIKGDITLTGLGLEQPKFFILVLEDGTANYDIMIPSEEAPAEEAPAEEEEADDMTIAIDHWSITNGSFIYYDIKYVTFMDLEGLNLSGGGDITLEEFLMDTHVDAEKVIFEYDGVKYLDGQSLLADVELDMNYVDYTFSFKQNKIYLNDFGLSFDGFFGMPDNGYDLDLTFASEETSFKSLLSLMPALYAEDFADLTAEGNVQFDGSMKGLYSFEDDGMPAFRINLRVDEGNFKYPDLPAALEAVNVHLLVDNQDGVLDNTTVDLQQFSMKLGGTSTINAKAKITGLATPEVNAQVDANVDLGALAKTMPMEGMALSGVFGMKANVLGTYDEARDIIPTFDVNMNLAQGEVKYEEYPIPMQNITMAATAKNTSGRLDDTEIDLSKLSLSLDGEDFLVTGSLKNLANYTWNATINGGLDLGKVAGIMNLEGMELAGKMKIDLSTAGQYADLEAERFDKLPTSGSLRLENFHLVSPDLPQQVDIPVADLTFNPSAASVRQLDVNIGRSDLHLKGTVTNYLAYIMDENAVLKGTMDFRSTNLDLNQLMASEEAPVEEEETPEDTTSTEMEVVAIPRNLDFTLNSSLTKVYYDNLELDDVNGEIVVRDGVVSLNALKFQTLDGRFAVSGTYDSRDIEHPQADLDLDIKEVSIRSAYLASGLVRRLAPVAENMTGTFSTDFSLKTELQQNMMPDYGTITGAGLIAVAQAALNQGPLVSGLSEVSKLGSNAEGVSLKDIVLSARIEDGRLHVQPFDVKVGQYKTTVVGSTGLDGTLDYALQMAVPAGSAGQAFNSMVSGLTGNQANATSSNINLNLGLGGVYRDPKFSLRGTSAGDGGSLTSQVTAGVRDRANQAVDETREQVTAQVQESVQQAKDSVRSTVNAEAERAKREAEEKLRQEAEAAAEEAKNKVRDLFRRRGGGGGN